MKKFIVSLLGVCCLVGCGSKESVSESVISTDTPSIYAETGDSNNSTEYADYITNKKSTVEESVEESESIEETDTQDAKSFVKVLRDENGGISDIIVYYSDSDTVETLFEKYPEFQSALGELITNYYENPTLDIRCDVSAEGNHVLCTQYIIIRAEDKYRHYLDKDSVHLYADLLKESGILQTEAVRIYHLCGANENFSYTIKLVDEQGKYIDEINWYANDIATNKFSSIVDAYVAREKDGSTVLMSDLFDEFGYNTIAEALNTDMRLKSGMDSNLSYYIGVSEENSIVVFTSAIENDITVTIYLANNTFENYSDIEKEIGSFDEVSAICYEYLTKLFEEDMFTYNFEVLAMDGTRVYVEPVPFEEE